MPLTYAELRDLIDELPMEVQNSKAQGFVWDPESGGIIFPIAGIEPRAQALALNPFLASLTAQSPNQYFMVTVVRNATHD